MYQIIGSNSEGNSILYFNKVLVDVGVKYTSLQPHLDNVKVILMTHRHTDHIRESTIKRIVKEYPKLTFVCGEWLKPMLELFGVKRILVIEFDKWYNFGFCQVNMITAYHDVENCGYRIFADDKKILHITDTYTLDGIVAKDYDGYFLEANYDEIQIEKDILDKQGQGLFAYEIGARNSHLSFQKSVAFFKKNRKESSIYVPLHISHKYKNEQLNVLSIINEKENQDER